MHAHLEKKNQKKQEFMENKIIQRTEIRRRKTKKGNEDCGMWIIAPFRR